MQRFYAHAKVLCVLLALSVFVGASGAVAGQVSGAVYTTLEEGTQVNLNIYDYKEDVYFAGGPGWNAPATASGLPDGEYYFMVTDPSGSVNLSLDPICCRKVRVNTDGVIDKVYPCDCPGFGTHKSYDGETVPHSDLGAITVQLMPYDDTPNKGGVYKLWITKVEDYALAPLNAKGKEMVQKQDGVFGFIPAYCKTDNFKVKESQNGGGPQSYSFFLTLQKFNDANVNATWDAEEEEVTGWQIEVTDPDGVTNNYYTPRVVEITRDETDGPFIVQSVEDHPTGTLQTVAILDGAIVSAYPAAHPLVIVDFEGKTNGETHNVIYGNVGLGQVQAKKFYDRNGDGAEDEGEPGVAGWLMTFVGTDVLGAAVGPITIPTDATGVAVLDGLLPGTYTVDELSAGLPVVWVASNGTIATCLIESTVDGTLVVGTIAYIPFGNYATGEADFGTKGYWHNKNGLAEIDQFEVDYVNELAPYAAPSSYFDAGDEPFDGLFENGDPVAASNGAIGEIAAEGTTLAEISQFLVDANAGGDPREQLAQQLLAFIFNALNRLDDPLATIELPSGEFVSAQSLIDDAIAAWLGGDEAAQDAIKTLLDTLNNSDALPFIYFNPPPVVY